MTTLEEENWRDAYRLLHGPKRVYTWYSPNKGNGFRLDEGFVNTRLIKRMTEARYVWGELDGSARRDVLSDHAALILDFAD